MDRVTLPLLFLYTFVVVGCGIAALVFQIRNDLRNKGNNPLEPWRLKWSEALLIGWGILTAALALAIALGHVAPRLADPSHQTIVHVLGWQGGLLLLLIGLIYLYPSQFTLKLSPQKLGLWRTTYQAVLHFLCALVLLIPINLCWRAALTYLENQGYGNFMQEQDIVGLLSNATPLQLAALGVTAIIIAPIAEEILFRGLLYRFLKSRLSPRWAMIGSSVLFGVIHFNVLTFIPLVFLGMILARAYESTGSLKVPILLHAFFNANATLLILATPYIEAATEKLKAF